MNWYRFVKIAQIWNLSNTYSNQFESDLQDLYRLEYMWSMINQRPFNGLEQRRENISNQLRGNLNVVADEVKVILSGVFNNWLRNHAILDPETWAVERVGDEWNDNSESFDSMLGEYMRYSIGSGMISALNDPRNYQAMQNQSIRGLLNFANMNMDKMPYFKQAFEESLDEHKEYLTSTLEDEGLEEFSENHNIEFKTEEQAKAYIENISVGDVDMESLYYFEDAESMSEFISNSEVAEEILIEFYEYCVFPVWFAHWKAEGIEDTRATIEQISTRLEGANAENTQEFMAAVNAALNAAHQTGAMLEYIEVDTDVDNMKGILEDLSNGTLVPVWNDQLRQVGVQV
jgi:hypothetical protein